MAQAALIAAIRMPGATQPPGLKESCLYFTAFRLERELQCKLNIAGIAGTLDAPEIRSVADVAVGIQELSVIEGVEELRSELEVFAFADRQDLLHGKIKIVDSRPAADRPRSIAQQLKRS